MLCVLSKQLINNGQSLWFSASVSTPSPACRGSRNISTRLAPVVWVNLEQYFSPVWIVGCHLSWRFWLCSELVEASLGRWGGGAEKSQQCHSCTRCKDRGHYLADLDSDFIHVFHRGKVSKHSWWNVLAPSHLVEVGLVGLLRPEATDLPVTACSLSSAQVNQVKDRRQLPARRVFVCKNVMAGHSHPCNRCGQEAQSRAHLAAAPTLLRCGKPVRQSVSRQLTCHISWFRHIHHSCPELGLPCTGSTQTVLEDNKDTPSLLLSSNLLKWLINCGKSL